MRLKNIRVALSQLVPASGNPRQVKPGRQTHAELVASIRSFGFFSSLVVKPGEKEGRYAVVAGRRRLLALREVHGDEDPQVSCVLVGDDGDVAEAIALAENFHRVPLHPLDEAEAFSELASAKGKTPKLIASEFGVTLHYVNQRMRLSSLAPVVKAAYRRGTIDTGTAEAFAAVPEDRQAKVWEELGGQPRHAQHVRNVIAHDWIDAGKALFGVSALPEAAVSKDLFGGSVLVERSAFMEAQSAALEKEKAALVEDGWADVVIGPREAVYGEMSALSVPQREFDAKTTAKLEKLAERRNTLEGTEIEEVEALDEAVREIVEAAPVFHSEETKTVGTVFLILSADGGVERSYRVPRGRIVPRRGDGESGGDGDGVGKKVTPPTSADLSDKQKSAVFTHHTLAVREALLGDELRRKRVLALILHDKVRSEALAVRPDANGVTLHATMTEGFSSPAFDRVAAKRKKLDPMGDLDYVTDEQAYELISGLSKSKLEALIEVLTVELLTCHPLRATPLVGRLAGELKVDLRKAWKPDAAWLSSYRKGQLAHLLAELHGPTYSPAHETRKKTELVEAVAKLFADAADGKLEDVKLAERVNRWMPSCLREVE